MKMFSWGANSYGQLSHGIKSEQCLNPTEAATCQLEDIVTVAAGGGHTLVLDSAGNLFGSGSNSNGQLADCRDNTTVLSQIEALQGYKLMKIECGWDSSYAITKEGTALVWGSNKYGQLGIPKGEVVSTKYPVVVQLPHIVQISAGLRHTAFLSNEGHVFMCGQGRMGQLGVLNSDGSIPKEDCDSLVRVQGLENIQQVACGQHHTLALTCDGLLYGWGDNRRGQLREGESLFPTPEILMALDNRATIRAGWTHSAVLSDGRVTTWGRNNYNQLGHSSGLERVSKPEQLISLRDVQQLELGSEHNLALLGNGEVWSWGWNEHGNCGTGTTDNVAVPQLISVPWHVSHIAAGAGHSLAYG